MAPRSKSKKSKSRKSPMAKYKRTLMDVNECMSKTVKQIRKTEAYRKLVPFGTYRNKSNAYHFGNKSTLRKGKLCEALSNPKSYHAKIKKKKGNGKRKGANAIKNAGPRKRFSRLGNCTPASGPNKRTAPCTKKFKHSGLTTTAKKCCYKKKQSEATKLKRKRNAAAKKASKKKYDSKKGITQKSTGRRVRKSRRKKSVSPQLKRKKKKAPSKRKSKRKS